MTEIFVNLKRFDVPGSLGGVCSMDKPGRWIEWILDESIKNGLGELRNMEVTFLLPESLIIPAIDKLSTYSVDKRGKIAIGCQGVFREDVAKGGNFGAFTTNRPAAAAKTLGCTWAIIGHSEERKDKLGIISTYDPDINLTTKKQSLAKNAVDRMINAELICALKADLNVLLCVGETSEEKGEGSFEEQIPRIKETLKSQLETGLRGFKELSGERKVTIGYEPIWAIGPGKTPPGAEYIAFVSTLIKDIVKEIYSIDIAVVYGGGLKEENAASIAAITSIDGGLVALTRFTGQIGFYPEDLKKIIEKYTLWI